MTLRIDSLLAFGLASVLALPVAWGSINGNIQSVSGEVFLTLPGQNETPATVNTSVIAGTKLRTGTNGRLEIKLDSGSILRIRPNSSLQLSPHNRKAKKKSSLLLFVGRIWSKIAPSSDGSREYEIKTPGAVCGVRGTEFETGVGADGSARVQVNEGSVAINDSRQERLLGAGQEVDSNEYGLGSKRSVGQDRQWQRWSQNRKARIQKFGGRIMKAAGVRIQERQKLLNKLLARKKAITSRIKKLQERANMGDTAAKREITELKKELAIIADQIADVGDFANAQFGHVNYLAQLANDPRFDMIDRKNLQREAASLLRLQSQFDQMVKEGTDISMAAMEKLLDDMGKGKRGTLKEKEGSTKDDLFDKGKLDFDFDKR